MKFTDDQVDSLLARGRLGGPGRDQVLTRILAQTRATQTARSRWVAWGSALGTATAFASAVLVFAPSPFEPAPSEIRPKGAMTGAPVWLDLACSGGTLTACPVGATLVFGVGGAARSGYLAAYAEPEAGGERIWYFSAETETPAVSAVSEGSARPAPRGIRIGPEHAPGPYVVRVWLGDRPLSRSTLLASTPDPSILEQATLSLVVISP